MAAVAAHSEVGTALRRWRERRRLTQLELALDAGISTRHLSFVETGRSHPGRDLMMRILDELAVPFRERNRLLIAAGHAPAFPERSFEDPELAPVRAALDRILAGHEPYPAMAVDRRWDIVAVNAPVLAMAQSLDIAPELLAPPANALRASLHPRGLAPLIEDLGGWLAFFRERLERQLAVTGDDELVELLAEVDRYPLAGDEDDGGGFDPAAGDEDDGGFDPATGTLGPLRVRMPDGSRLSFFGMFATFDTPFEVTMSELALELLFPADEHTASYLEEAFA